MINFKNFNFSKKLMNIHFEEFSKEYEDKLISLERDGLLKYFEKHVKDGLSLEKQKIWLKNCLDNGFVTIIKSNEKFILPLSFDDVEISAFHFIHYYLYQENHHIDNPKPVLNGLDSSLKLFQGFYDYWNPNISEFDFNIGQRTHWKWTGELDISSYVDFFSQVKQEFPKKRFTDSKLVNIAVSRYIQGFLDNFNDEENMEGFRVKFQTPAANDLQDERFVRIITSRNKAKQEGKKLGFLGLNNPQTQPWNAFYYRKNK